MTTKQNGERDELGCDALFGSSWVSFGTRARVKNGNTKGTVILDCGHCFSVNAAKQTEGGLICRACGKINPWPNTLGMAANQTTRKNDKQ